MVIKEAVIDSRRVTQVQKEETGMNTMWTLMADEVPAVEGLIFRGFRDDADFAAMVSIIDRSRKADDNTFVETENDLRTQYAHLVNSDPDTDMIFAEIAGEPVGYGRVWWAQVENGPRYYGHFANLVPEWRGAGIRRTMLKHNEARLLRIASEHAIAAPRCYEAWVSEKETDWCALLEQEGYTPERYSFGMVRPNLDNIPDLPLPEGLEVRPVPPEAYIKVWEAAREAFRDHWGFSEDEWAEDTLKGWQEHETFQPDLWQVAWDGDEVAGMILNYINESENKANNRKRGWTETICVRRPYRRQGLARALIARSLKLHRDLGMTETALGVDAQNPNGALQLYTSMGYQIEKHYTLYRKPFEVATSL